MPTGCRRSISAIGVSNGRISRVDRQLAQPARNQLGELRAEIENDDGLMIHRGRGLNNRVIRPSCGMPRSERWDMCRVASEVAVARRMWSCRSMPLIIRCASPPHQPSSVARCARSCRFGRSRRPGAGRKGSRTSAARGSALVGGRVGASRGAARRRRRPHSPAAPVRGRRRRIERAMEARHGASIFAPISRSRSKATVSSSPRARRYTRSRSKMRRCSGGRQPGPSRRRCSHRTAGSSPRLMPAWPAFRSTDGVEGLAARDWCAARARDDRRRQSLCAARRRPSSRARPAHRAGIAGSHQFRIPKPPAAGRSRPASPRCSRFPIACSSAQRTASSIA